MKEYKNLLVVALVVLVLLILFYYWANAQGVKAGTSQSAVNIPGNPAKPGSTSLPLSDAETLEIKDLATRLHTDIYSWLGSLDRDTDAYYTLSKASDRIMVGVYNFYNVTFNANIISDIKGESTINPFLVDATDIILARYDGLKIK